MPDTSKSWAWSCLLWSFENLKKKVEIDRTFLGFIDIFKGFLTKSFLYGTPSIWYNLYWKSWIEKRVAEAVRNDFASAFLLR